MPSQRKERKTYSLSREAVAFIEKTKRERRAASDSSVLEDLIAQAKRQRELEKIHSDIASYYSAKSEQETKEDAGWGRFADSQFPLE